MISTVKEALWTQFGASIDMLKNAIEMWPDNRWQTDKKFFYVAYHVTVFLDYYLTNPPEAFSPGLAFTITEPDHAPPEALDDVVPDRIYSKTELLEYLHVCREKCRQLIANLTDEKISERWIEDSGDMNYSVLEILLYNMRHVQHHAAQLNMLLRKELNDAPRWVARDR
jgi:hypothetical protein